MRDGSPPRTVIRVQMLLLAACLVVAVAMLAAGEWLAALGFGTAAVATGSAVLAAQRWEVWRHVAEARPQGYPTAPPD